MKVNVLEEIPTMLDLERYRKISVENLFITLAFLSAKYGLPLLEHSVLKKINE
jgi:hypothetical protein